MVSEEQMKLLVKDVPKLILSDRCDKCKWGQAYARWMNPAGHFLDFCMHHSNEFQASLLGQGFFVVEDKRPLVISKASSSDNLSGEVSLKVDEEDVG
jgi:hypothetical protein